MMQILQTLRLAGYVSGVMLGTLLSVDALAFDFEVIPLTVSEQAARINAIAIGNQRFVRGTSFPRSQTTFFKPYIQRDYREQYKAGSSAERKAISERVGNQAGARYAAERGWKQILGSKGRAIPQGPDSAYWDPASKTLRVIERKGGSSKPRFNYRSRQGTNLYHINAAKRAISSPKTSNAEKIANARIIKAAQQNRLQSAVVFGGKRGARTAPKASKWDASSVKKRATYVEKILTRKDPKLRSIFRSAAAANNAEIAGSGGTLANVGKKSIAALGLLGSGMIAWDAYGQSSRAWEMWNDPKLSGYSAVTYLQTGNAVAKWAEAGTMGLGAAAELGLLGQHSLKAFGQAAGNWILPVAIGAEILNASMAVYDYQNGLISGQQFDRTMIGSGIFVTCTSGGAIVGSVFGGVGALPGATVGAIVGGFAQGSATLYWYFVDRKFDQAQDESKRIAIYRHYRVTP